MKYLILTLALILSFAGCMRKSPQLVWSEEFDNGSQLDTLSWNYKYGDGCPNVCGWGNNELEIYTDDPRNVRIENGVLVIEALKTDSVWTSARITTQGKQTFTYGRIEFKAKLPSGVGTWPALWMLNDKIDQIGWPAAGEIDIMEHVGRRPGVIQSSMHTQSSSGNTINTGMIDLPTYDAEFHIYAADWNKDRITVSVDGQEYYTYQPEVKNKDTWPFDSPFYIIINLAIGGNFGGPVSPDLTRARMEVDYVKVFQ
ncbi:MAG: glycoside hydrolase family 16 protein [Cyclobacteriaceae bacterium]